MYPYTLLMQTLNCLLNCNPGTTASQEGLHLEKNCVHLHSFSPYIKGKNCVHLHSFSPYIKGKNCVHLHSFSPYIKGKNCVHLHSFSPYIKGKNCVHLHSFSPYYLGKKLCTPTLFFSLLFREKTVYTYTLFLLII